MDVRLDEVVLRALERKPERRYQEVSEVKTMVETIAGAGTSGARDAEASAAEPEFSRMALSGGRWLVVTALLLTLGVVSISQHNLGIYFFLLAAITAFIGTIQGWMAITQIRRSGGRLCGMWLAVFDGLAVPLLAIDALVFGAILFLVQSVAALLNASGRPNSMALLLFTLVTAIPIDWLIIRRIWRAVSDKDIQSASSPGRRRRAVWAGAIAAILVLGVVCAFFLVPPESPSALANSPHKLSRASNAAVIEAALVEPQSAWAWIELGKRASQLHTEEANHIVDGLAAWMRREYPHGYNQPLFWMGRFLDEMKRYLVVGETNALEFLQAYYGQPVLDPLPRIREGESSLHIVCRLRSSWLGSHPFGFELLNEMRSITIDGQQVPARRAGQYDQMRYAGQVKLPSLSPGKHILRCEVDSAFIEAIHLEGVENIDVSANWPLAARRWTRVCEAELMVYARDAEIVSLTEDAALDPVAGGTLSLRHVIIRNQGERFTATLPFSIDDNRKQPVSVDVTLRVGNQTVDCGTLFAVTMDGKGAHNGPSLAVDIESLDPEVKEAEVLLKPNPGRVEEFAGVDRIWGRDIVIRPVPLSRQDLYGARSR